MNNYLFQLAERPPGDIAALLASFKSIPPVIRRRAKELFDTIQDTVKEYAEKPEPPIPANDVPMPLAQPEMETVPEVKATPSTSDALQSRLWSKGLVILRLLACSISDQLADFIGPQSLNTSGLPTSKSLSTLFGSMLVNRDGRTQKPNRYSTTTSTLFSSKPPVSTQ